MRIMKPNCTAIVHVTKGTRTGSLGELIKETEAVEVEGYFSMMNEIGDLGNLTTAPLVSLSATLTLTGGNAGHVDQYWTGARVTVEGKAYLISDIQKADMKVFRRSPAAYAVILRLEESR